MLGTSNIVTFIATTQADRARAFYRDVLGLTFVEDTPFAQVFSSNGVMLRVTPVEKHAPPAHTVLGWDVADIENEIRALNAKGVVFERYGFLKQDDAGVWTSPSGAKIAWFKDPDGNTLSLTEF